MTDRNGEYFLRDAEIPSFGEKPSDGLINRLDLYGPTDLTEMDWLEVGGFMDQNVMVPGGGEEYRMLKGPDPDILKLISQFWRLLSRSVVHVAHATNGRIVGTAVTTVNSVDFATQRGKDTYGQLADNKDYITVSHLGVHPGFRGQGVFKNLLRGGIEQVVELVAETHGEVKFIINLAPGDDPNKWAREGFEPIPEDVQKLLPLRHVMKTVGRSY